MKFLHTRLSEGLAYLGSIASLVALLNPSFSQYPIVTEMLSSLYAQIALYVALVCSAIIFSLNFIFAEQGMKRIRSGKKKDVNIEKEMRRIIDVRSNVTILSRNLSWAEMDTDLHKILQKKASAGDLTLYIHSENQASKSLSQLGARVFHYGQMQFVPESRFTIVSRGSITGNMAIGYADGDDHIITRFRHGGPEFHLANDLLDVLEKACVSAN